MQGLCFKEAAHPPKLSPSGSTCCCVPFQFLPNRVTLAPSREGEIALTQSSIALYHWA